MCGDVQLIKIKKSRAKKEHDNTTALSKEIDSDEDSDDVFDVKEGVYLLKTQTVTVELITRTEVEWLKIDFKYISLIESGMQESLTYY